MLFRSQIVRALLLVVFAVVHSIGADAQFRVVDAESGVPLSGVYVFDSNDNLLGFSNKDGMVGKYSGKVSVKMMTFQTETIDADTFTGDLRLQSVAYSLPEVSVSPSDYIKISGAFRDVYRNDGKIVLYREGTMDFYYKVKSKKFTRRVRACRQYEHPNLLKESDSSVMVWEAPSFDLSKVHRITRNGTTETEGDTTYYGARYRGVSSNRGIMYLESEGKYRYIIDNMKFIEKPTTYLLGMTYQLKQFMSDWTYGNPDEAWSSILSFNQYTEALFQFSDDDPQIDMKGQMSFVVIGVVSMDLATAKAEMKNKKTSKEYVLPECLADLKAEVNSMKTNELTETRFREI